MEGFRVEEVQIRGYSIGLGTVQFIVEHANCEPDGTTKGTCYELRWDDALRFAEGLAAVARRVGQDPRGVSASSRGHSAEAVSAS